MVMSMVFYKEPVCHPTKVGIKRARWMPQLQLTLTLDCDMTCYRLGPNGTLSASANVSPAASVRIQPQPLVEYSPSSNDRATLMTIAGSSSLSAFSTGQRRRRRRSGVARSTARAGGNRRKRTRVSKIRIVKGRVALRVTGRPGVQHIGAGQLVRFVPINKLRAAARRVLNASVGRHRRRRRLSKGRVRKRRQRRRRRRN